MQIFIARGEEQHGPYPLEQAKDLLAKGVLKPGDYAYHEGLSDWTPLLEVIVANSEPEASPTPSVGPSISTAPTPKSKSNATLVIGIVAGLLIFGGLAAASGLYFFLKDEPTELANTTTPDAAAPPPKTMITAKKPVTVLWEFETGNSVYSSPAIGSDGTVYVGSLDKKLYAINGKSEVKLWEFETGGEVLSSPAIGSDGTVYVGSKDKKLYAINGKSGVKLWEFKTGSYVLSSPAIGSDGTVYVGSRDNKLYAINGKSGVKLWEFETGGEVHSSPAIGPDGTVYVGSGLKLYAINGKSGFKLWEFETGEAVYSSPAIGSDGTVYVGSFDKKLYAINGKSGIKLWEFKTGGVIWDSSPAIGSDGTVYVGSLDNKLYAINGKSGIKLWEFKTGGQVLSSPAIGSDGTVYVGSLDNKLYAIKTDPKGLAESPWPMRGQNAQHTGHATTVSDLPVVKTEPAPHAPQRGLVAYYPFNGNTRDESGHGHDGTVVGATLTADRHGKPDSAYQFKLGNHIKVEGLMGKPKNITLSAWVKLDGQQGQSGAEIISLGVAASIRVDSKSNDSRKVGTGGITRMQANAWMNTLAKVNYTGTGWHQIVFTFDDNTDKQITYVDGKQMALKENPRSIVYEGQETDTVIGIHGRGYATWMAQGIIDDIRVYDRALSTEEVRALFLKEKPAGKLQAGKEIEGTTVADLRAKAKAGDPRAQVSLGVKFINGTDGLKKNLQATEKLWLRAAKQGNTTAQSYLGIFYSRGELGEKDPAKAYRWAKLSLTRGNQRAQQLVDKLEKELNPQQIAEADAFVKAFKPVPEKAGGVLGAIRAGLPNYPVLTPNADPKKIKFDTVNMNRTSVKSGDLWYDGFRFAIPKEGGELVWAFRGPIKNWYITPLKGRMNGFRSFDQHTLKRDVLPMGKTGDKVYLQTLPAENLKAGEEYVIWFSFTKQVPVPVYISLNIFAGNSPGTKAIAEALDKAANLVKEPAEKKEEISAEDIIEGKLEVIKAKLKAGANPDFIIYPKRKGAVLHVAVSKGTIEVVKLILAGGAKPNPINWLGKTPLDRFHEFNEKKEPAERMAPEAFAAMEALLRKHGAKRSVQLNGGEPAAPAPEPAKPDKKPLTKEESAKVIEAVIRKELKKPTGELTKADLGKVTGLDLLNTKITDAGLKEVGKMKQLTKLNLYGTQITDAGLKEVAKLQKLTELELNDTQITDAGLKEVAKLQQLTSLGLYDTQITDAGLKEVAKMKQLNTLDLYDTQITNAGLKDVAKLKNLIVLSLMGTKTTDAGLKEVAKCKQLKTLYLNDTQVTKAGVAELKKALPKCWIGHNAKK